MAAWAWPPFACTRSPIPSPRMACVFTHAFRVWSCLPHAQAAGGSARFAEPKHRSAPRTRPKEQSSPTHVPRDHARSRYLRCPVAQEAHWPQALRSFAPIRWQLAVIIDRPALGGRPILLFVSWSPRLGFCCAAGCFLSPGPPYPPLLQGRWKPACGPAAKSLTRALDPFRRQTRRGKRQQGNKATRQPPIPRSIGTVANRRAAKLP